MVERGVKHVFLVKGGGTIHLMLQEEEKTVNTYSHTVIM